MTGPLHVAFLWHMHQPSYRDPNTGDMALPWVRLHACRAYYDMAWLQARHPAMAATYNMVPILVEQLEAYGAGARDQYWDLSVAAPSTLSPTDRARIRAHFFAINHDTGIRPRARYWALLQKRDRAFSDAEILDLQVLFNLSWMGFAARAEWPLIDTLEAKGRDFSEAEKHALLAVQLEVIERVLPAYRALAEAGQIEITTTPYYHPILPLIIDTESAARCQPDRPRPPRFAWPEDAAEHVRRAVAAHTRAFGVAPVGAWPAEGSVSPEAVTLLKAHGVDWIASDEAQLWQSLTEKSGGEALYQPYRLLLGAPAPHMVFRDRELSDRIGFTYARNSASAAVDDLIAHLDGVRERAEEGGLILIALDGENPWEAYADSGRPFLETLYARLEAHPGLQPTTVRDYLDAHPPGRALSRLHSGSWINGDFGIWIGDPMDNVAWRLLGEARRVFENARGDVAADVAERAYTHILEAEGSDWFWWFGEPFESENDADFDRLFRGHLARVYTLLGRSVPAALSRSLYGTPGSERGKAPQRLISPKIQEVGTFFDWSGAGEVALAGPAGSMHRAVSYFRRLRYGFDLERLYLQLEAEPSADLAGVELTLVVGEVKVPVRNENGVEFGMDRGRWSMSVTFATVGAHTGDALDVQILLMRGAVQLDRYPANGALSIEVPSEDFDTLHWSV